MTYKPTSEQQAAIDMAVTGEDLILNAFAGAGKTSTLVMIADALAPKQGLYLAFNQSIAKEAQLKMPLNVQAKTFHALAFSKMPEWMYSRFSEMPMHVNDYCKTNNIKPIWYTKNENFYMVTSEAKSFVKKSRRRTNISPYKQVKLINTAINNYLGSVDKYYDSKFSYNAVFSNMPDLKSDDRRAFDECVQLVDRLARKTLKDWMSPEGYMPIGKNHSLYLKYWAINNPIIEADFVLFDEAQDADPLMLYILGQQSLQIIYVGDKHQQIYRWRGAVNALESIDANKLKLTQSFRFGQKLASTCQPMLNYLQETSLFKGTQNQIEVRTNFHTLMSHMKEYDAVLCRTNGGVVMTLLRLVLSGVKCYTNIDTNGIINRLRDMEELERETGTIGLDEAGDKRYVCKNKTLEFRCWKEFEHYMKEFNTDYELSLTYRIYQEYDVNDVVNALNKSKDTTGTIISTAHKSKGLEWDNVMLIDDFVNFFFKTDDGKMVRVAGSEIKVHYHLDKLHEVQKSIKNCIEKNNMDKDCPALVAMLKKIDPKNENGVAQVTAHLQSAKDEMRLLYVAMTRAKKRLDIQRVMPVLSEFLPLCVAAKYDDEDENEPNVAVKDIDYTPILSLLANHGGDEEQAA